MPGGQINDPWSGKHYSLPFLPASPSSPSRTLEGLFELTQRPSRVLDSPCPLLLELQRKKDTVKVKCTALAAEVPGHCQELLTQTLIACAFENALLFVVKNQEGPGPPQTSEKTSIILGILPSLHTQKSGQTTE